MAVEPIVVVPYDPEWPRRFEAERVLLNRVLAPWLKGVARDADQQRPRRPVRPGRSSRLAPEGGIHHVGSTAVPGLASKPIIDMVAGVRDLDEARAAFEPLIEHSYVYTPHRPGIAHHFSKPSPRLGEATHNLHLTEPGSDLWRERLVFRDALRADPALAAEYEALKLRFAQEHRDDVGAYTGAKRAFVVRVLATAGIELGRR